MTTEQGSRIKGVAQEIEAATCECGKLLADCQCANGGECECGGDPAMCQADKTENTIELALPKKS